jgi:aminoglycoside phosphotransferase (APT) family kinase protein
VSSLPHIPTKLSAANAIHYLRSRGYVHSGERSEAYELSGGVSNMVVRVSRSAGNDIVLKQVREQLNVAEPWYCSVERIWRETDMLRQCARLVGKCPSTAPLAVAVPQLLFEDRDNYLYAMSGAAADHVVWKDALLTGETRQEIAATCGMLLAALHAGSWHDETLARQFDDRSFFNDLRLDPYYRHAAVVRTEFAPALDRLVDSVLSNQHCLVHGDFSPKNLLIDRNRLTLIDFEVGHYGDPAFDVGFFLSHLVLKAFFKAPRDAPYWELIDVFWRSYCAAMAVTVSSIEVDSLVARAIQNFAGCAIARLDGKSKLDYLKDTGKRDAVREVCRRVLIERPSHWIDVRELAAPLIVSND